MKTCGFPWDEAQLVPTSARDAFTLDVYLYSSFIFIHLYSSYEDSFGANPCLNAMLPLVSHIISKNRHQVFIDIFRQQGIGINFLRKTVTRFPFCKGSKSSLPQPGRSLAKGICRNPSLAVLHIKAFLNSSNFQISSTHQRCTPRFSHVFACFRMFFSCFRLRHQSQRPLAVSTTAPFQRIAPRHIAAVASPLRHLLLGLVAVEEGLKLFGLANALPAVMPGG